MDEKLQIHKRNVHYKLEKMFLLNCHPPKDCLIRKRATNWLNIRIYLIFILKSCFQNFFT